MGEKKTDQLVQKRVKYKISDSFTDLRDGDEESSTNSTYFCKDTADQILRDEVPDKVTVFRCGISRVFRRSTSSTV